MWRFASEDMDALQIDRAYQAALPPFTIMASTVMEVTEVGGQWM